jgi:hypothetical protein
MLGFCMLLFSCHHDYDSHHDYVDERYPFLGEYHAVETFYNPNTGLHEEYHYDIEVVESHDHGLEIVVTGYGNNGIYGTSCSVYGMVRGSHIDVDLNVCHYNNNVDYEISGHGDLSADGDYLSFDLHIDRCQNGICNHEPEVRIEAHRY